MNSVILNDDGEFSDQVMPKLTPTGTDILVKVKSISINPVDIKKNQHTAHAKVLGFDAAGVVSDVGPAVKKFHRGDVVFYAGTTQRAGSYADEQLVDENLVALAPNTQFNDLAALPLSWLTAAEILFEKLHYSHNPVKNQQQTILVINGAGGVGSILTQLAHLIGLRVIATSSPQNYPWLKRNGVDMPIDYHQDLVQQVEALGITVDNSINLFDTGRYFDETIELVRPFGHLVNVTSTGAPVDIRKLQPKSLSFDWELMFTKSNYAYRTQSQGDLLNQLGRLLSTHKIHSTRTQTLKAAINAETIRKAHQIVKTHQMVGKLVIENQATN